jgi:hypothetical protein
MSAVTPGHADCPAGPSPAAPPRAGRYFRLDNRFLAPILITCILVVGQYEYRFLESYWHTGLAIAASIVLELILGRLATGRWPHLASAYISGISVGILVRSPFLWPYILCSLLAISSKYALRVRGRHLWNPSNLGVSLLLFLAPEAVATLSQQWGNELWPLVVIWLLGTIILYRLGRLHITLTYVAAFFVLSFVRSGLHGEQWINEIAPLTGPMYQLFIFFMITDPKTTTRTKARQCAVAVLVAVAETAFRLNPYDPYFAIHAPYYALFVVAPVTNLLEIWWDARHAPAACPAKTDTVTAPDKAPAVLIAPPVQQQP